MLHEWQTRDHLSVMGGVTPAGRISVLVHQETLNGRHTIEFLKHLIGHVGSRLLVIWDGSPIPRRAEVKGFLDGAEGRGIRVEPLPPYAPDLNPVEGAWQHLKHVERRNVACLDWEELHLELHLAIDRLRQKHRLIQQFLARIPLALVILRGAGLKLENFTFLAQHSVTAPSSCDSAGGDVSKDHWKRVDFPMQSMSCARWPGK